MNTSVKGEFVFFKQDQLGVSDAETDMDTLLECFVSTSDYEAVADFERPECFILGRAGVGKTALLTKLKNEKDGVIVIEPEGLALNFIANSDIIKVVTEMGADLNVFFRLLWRHVLCVEVFRRHSGIVSKADSDTFIDEVISKFRRQKPKQQNVKAIQYLEKWGPSFWKQTDGRVRELTAKIESDIESSIAGSNLPISAKIKAGQKLSEEEKTQIVKLTRNVIDEVQMRELSQIISMLDDAISDKQKKYYIVVDKLDEDWVDESLRYSLIKALIQTANDFGRVNQVRLLIVLRMDLIERVYTATPSNSFQQEKFADLNLPITWTRKELTDLINLRINHLVKKRYVKSKVTYKDLLPDEVGGQPTMDYLLDRTFMRPRDLIQFFNACINEATEHPRISVDMIMLAEREYSRGRLRAVKDEWKTDYPYLGEWLGLLKKTNPQFVVGEIEEDTLSDMALNYADSHSSKSETGSIDRIFKHANGIFENTLSIEDFRGELIYAFYMIGLLGIHLNNSQPVWSYEQRRHISPEDIDQDTVVSVHPMFWSALGTNVGS